MDILPPHKRHLPASYQAQAGVALVVGLVLVLVITLIAIAGFSNSTVQAKMATNSQQRNTTFQAAESALSNAIIEIEGIPMGGIPGNSEVLAKAIERGTGVTHVVAIDKLKTTTMDVSVSYTYQETSGLATGISLNADENSTIIGRTKFILEGNAVMTASGAKTRISQGISYE